MFRYEYRCLNCKVVTEVLRLVDDRNNPVCCKSCGDACRKIISLSRPQPDMKPYYDENLETYITGKQHREKVMKKKGVTACG